MEHAVQSSSLLDVLEKILDKGLVVAGDIKISLANVDLLTIKIRLIVASVDKAKEIGLDWWEHDPYLSSRATAQLDRNLSKITAESDRLSTTGHLTDTMTPTNSIGNGENK